MKFKVRRPVKAQYNRISGCGVWLLWGVIVTADQVVVEGA